MFVGIAELVDRLQDHSRIAGRDEGEAALDEYIAYSIGVRDSGFAQANVNRLLRDIRATHDVVKLLGELGIAPDAVMYILDTAGI